MISVSEADAILNANLFRTKEEIVALQESACRVLKEKIYSDRDQPPFDRVMMDGIAISLDSSGLKSSYRVVGIQYAGDQELTTDDYTHADCVEVMTGAVLPKFFNTVIRYEDVDIKNGVATIHANLDVKIGSNVHDQGKDSSEGALLMTENLIIRGAHIGVLASVGKDLIRTSKPPKVALIASGNELVSVENVPLPYQIRMSNVYSLSEALEQLKIPFNIFHIPDDHKKSVQRLTDIVQSHDVLLFSGGVSKGKKDYIPGILNDLGFNKLFHRVKQKPGKPFLFSKNENNQFAFGLPGNPVSTFICFYRYVMPWIKRSLGISEDNQMTAQLTEDVLFNPPLTRFLLVSLHMEKGVLYAKPESMNGSGDFVGLAGSEAFLELPQDLSGFKKGESFPVLKYS